MTDLFGYAFGAHNLFPIQQNQMEVITREVNRCADVFKQVFLFEWPAGYLSFVGRYLRSFKRLKCFELFMPRTRTPSAEARNSETTMPESGTISSKRSRLGKSQT